MTQPSSGGEPPFVPPPARPKISATKMVLGCLAVPVVLVLLGVLALAAWWNAENRRAARELEAEVQQIRARGEPLTTVELDAYYLPAADRPDMTQEILAALAFCDAPDLQVLARDLPLVGQGPEIPTPPEPWEQLPEVADFLQRQQTALETFHAAARRNATARYPIDLSAGISTLLPHVTSLRNAARVLQLQGRVALHRGRPQEAVESVLALFGLAGTLDQEPVLVSQLVRLAILGIAMHELAYLQSTARLADADIARLQEALRNLQLEPALKRAFIGERAIGYMACLDPLAAGREDWNPTAAEMRALALNPPKRKDDAVMLLRQSNRILAAADEGLGAALQAASVNETELKALQQDGWSKFRYLLTLLLSPASRAAVEAFARMAAQRDAADAALAAELYRRKHGAWPPDLETLVPDYLPAVPRDPYDTQPLRMVVAPEEFRVYSIGKDLVDDGGQFTLDKPEPDVGFAAVQRPDEAPSRSPEPQPPTPD